MNKIEIENEIKMIENEIELKVKKYQELQKKYNGDSSYSKDIEDQIEDLEAKENKLKEQLEEAINDNHERIVEYINTIPDIAKDNFKTMQELLQDSDDIKEELEGFYYNKKAIEVLENTDKKYHLNSYMDLTSYDILNMIIDNETIEDAIYNLFTDYVYESAFSWAENFIDVLKKLDFNIIDNQELKELLEEIEAVEITYDYEDTYRQLYNLYTDYENIVEEDNLYYLFSEYITIDEAEEMAKQELETGGLARLYYFMGDVNFNIAEIVRVDGYGNLQEVTKEDLEFLKDEMISDIKEKLAE